MMKHLNRQKNLLIIIIKILSHESFNNKMVIGAPENTLNELRIAAIKQNTTTLRNRVNELGVAEPIVQQSGKTKLLLSYLV